MHYRRRYRRRKGNPKAFITIIVVFLTLIYGFMFVDQKVKPSVMAIAEVNTSVILSPLLSVVYVIG